MGLSPKPQRKSLSPSYANPQIGKLNDKLQEPESSRDPEITLSRSGTKKSVMVKPDPMAPLPRARQNILAPPVEKEKKPCCQPWIFFYQAVTCCLPGFLLTKMGIAQPRQAAWREKVALCAICVILCAALAFLTFGLQNAICIPPKNIFTHEQITQKPSPHNVIVHGQVYDMSPILQAHSNLAAFKNAPKANALINAAAGIDVSAFFPTTLDAKCLSYLAGSLTVSCTDPTNFPSISGCHPTYVNDILANILVGNVYYGWDSINSTETTLVVFNNYVLDVKSYLSSNAVIFGDIIDSIVRSHAGKDITHMLASVPNGIDAGRCLSALYVVGQIEAQTVGCFTAQVILYISLVIIGSLIVVRFVLAVWFSWFLSNKLGRLENDRVRVDPKRRTVINEGRFAFVMPDHQGQLRSGQKPLPERPDAFNPRPSQVKSKSSYCDELYAIMLVTCYSENENELRNTFESLAMTDYNEDFKVLFVVADGLVKGSGNTRTTPEICLSLLELDPNWPEPEPFAYQAVASGSKALNYAKVYVAWFNHQGRSVPTILVVKVGAPSEATAAKPGNRGKRDSQIMLMRFLERITVQERMCPFEYDLFQKFHYLMGVTPDHFEIVLMVDADTKVAPDSLARMAAVMASDPLVMGLCGETRIANKSDSYITRIQVFEYYLSHHLTKAFESCYGSVTCLPGCFSMYRIKCPLENGDWVPILANPDIVSIYSSSVVETLHQKNLLLLGEDRFLTTMMLRTFPKRKLMFVPRAFCKTTVPHTFKMLLSQRRRWINSTIHNLMELVLVDELCGIFCFSLQFAIFLELIGTVTLPAAILFTFVLIIVSIVGPVQVIPLILLAGILGLPAVLICMTSKRWVYVYWMLVYLTALPIWNFMLPTYAFWHFDDFSWGETRKVEGENAKEAHGDNDGHAITDADIPLKRWEEWERERRHVIMQNFKGQTPRTSQWGENVKQSLKYFDS
ncbi:chitin synthase 1 [Gorgonomyces haynaldii]|nr:chitin synthase 1 [Gorgonomyces haynaldii]